MYIKNTYIREISGKWYAFKADLSKGQVYSIGNDCPQEGGLWFARLCNEGIKYVSTPSPTRKAAYQKASKHGIYCGEI